MKLRENEMDNRKLYEIAVHLDVAKVFRIAAASKEEAERQVKVEMERLASIPEYEQDLAAEGFYSTDEYEMSFLD